MYSVITCDWLRRASIFMRVCSVPRAGQFSVKPLTCGPGFPASSNVGDLGPCGCADYNPRTRTLPDA